MLLVKPASVCYITAIEISASEVKSSLSVWIIYKGGVEVHRHVHVNLPKFSKAKCNILHLD